MNILSTWKSRAFVFAFILPVAPWLVTSQAQDIQGAVIVNVPFAFENGSQHLDPGLYTIRMENQGTCKLVVNRALVLR
jgi:hypothetical protein